MVMPGPNALGRKNKEREWRFEAILRELHEEEASVVVQVFIGENKLTPRTGHHQAGVPVAQVNASGCHASPQVNSNALVQNPIEKIHQACVIGTHSEMHCSLNFTFLPQ